VWGSGVGLLPRQLLIQLGDVVVPLRLVAEARDGRAQTVLLPEALDPELPPVVPTAVGEDGLGAGQRAGLLVDQPHVPVETCRGTGLVRGRRRRHRCVS